MRKFFFSLSLFFVILVITGCHAPQKVNLEYLKDPNGISAAPVSNGQQTVAEKLDAGAPAANAASDSSAFSYQGGQSSDTSHDNAQFQKPVASEKDGIIDIREKFFITSINDVYINAPDYIGKTLRLEGLFEQTTIPMADGPTTFRYVVRYGPGCCANDAKAGFEIFWEKDEYPKKHDWIRATGYLEEYFGGKSKTIPFLRLHLTDLEVLPTRGAEYVLN